MEASSVDKIYAAVRTKGSLQLRSGNTDIHPLVVQKLRMRRFQRLKIPRR